MPSDHPARVFVSVLKEMVEGRMEPAAWFQWREENCDALQAAMPPGWFLRLKPSFLAASLNRAASVAVDGISYVLTAMNEPHEKTDRFARAYEEEFQEYCKRADAQRRESRQQANPVLDRLKQHFPKFAGLIRRRLESSNELGAPATTEELQRAEQSLGLKLPGALRRLFECSGRVSIDGLSIDIDVNLLIHPVASQLAGTSMLCFGEYCLQADGDQVLLRVDELSDDDPPVYYYAHEFPRVEPTKKRFTAWLESLSRSPLFRD
jgi:hypothetical protein